MSLEKPQVLRDIENLDNKIGNLSTLGVGSTVQKFQQIDESLTDMMYIVDENTNLQELINSVPNYSTLKFSKNIPNQQYPISSEVLINKSLHIDFNRIEIVQQTSGIGMFKITSSNVELRKGKLTGFQNIAAVGSEIAINCYGADSNNYIKNIVIEDCEISNIGYDGIKMQFVSNFRIRRNNIKNTFQAGVIGYSCKDGVVSYNKISDIKDSVARSYGVAMTRVESDSLEVNPRSSNVKIHHNTVENILEWEGIDTHGGDNIVIIDNTVLNCKNGIAIVSSDNGSQVQTFAPKNCVVAFNKVINSLETGVNDWGISVAGCNTNVEKALDCTVIGNTVKNHGLENSGTSGALYIRHTENLTISDNKIINPSPNGIFMSQNNYNFTIANNTFIDVWTTNAAQAVGILINTAPQTGIITGNTFKKNGKVATIVFNRAIRITPSSGILIELGDNASDADTYLTETANTYQSYRQTATGKIFRGTAIPTSGTWALGDFIDNNSKTLQGTAPNRYILLGYSCTVAGSPGSWVECRAITGS